MSQRTIKSLILSISLLLVPLMASATKVIILETHLDAGSQLMDLNWRRVANILGYDQEILPYNYLDSLHILQAADVVIIPSGVKMITPDQRDNIHQYILKGGNVYIQSEFKMNFTGNQLFDFLVNKSGGSFQWEGETHTNLNPISIPNYLSENDGPTTMDYFWNGTYGCGGEQIFPIMEYDNKHYGFIFIPDNATVGRIMTTSDQDWIKIATEVGQQQRLVMMRKMLKALAEGIEGLVTPDISINFLQQSICPNTGYDIEAMIDNTVLSYDLEWYKNGNIQNELSNQNKFDLNNLNEGDLLQAKLNLLDGCITKIIESNIVQIERVFPLSMSTPIIDGREIICSGEKGVFVAQIAQMPDPSSVTYSWFIGEQEQSVNNDTLIIDEPIDGAIISLSASFNDGCEEVKQSASNNITLSIIGNPIPNISISQNKTDYCTSDKATITIHGLSPNETYNIDWMVDGDRYLTNEISHVVPMLTNDHEVYASVSYTDPCKGLIQLSTQVASLKISQPLLKVIEKKNTSCGFDNGSLTLEGYGGIAPYSYEWNAKSVGNVITNLPMGMQTIQISDANGCFGSISTSIGEVNPTIIDSLSIENPSCNSEEVALVRVFPNPIFINDLQLSWADNDGNPIEADFTESEMMPGNYMVTASVNDKCFETKKFEINSSDIEDRLKKTFDVEAEYFLKLDLGIDPSEVKQISWTGGDGLSCLDCTWPTLLATKNQTFQVALVIESGCAYNFDVVVNVSAAKKLPYYAPSGFTPDGDGQNDQFEFFIDNTIASLQELLIFDRWGNTVYESASETEVLWDGTINGKMATKGIYVYVAKMLSKNGKEIIGNGSIMLIR